MLKQLMRHRWIYFVHGGLTLLLGLGLVGLKPLLEDRVLGTFIAVVLLLSTGFVMVAAVSTTTGAYDLPRLVHRRTVDTVTNALPTRVPV